MSARLWHRRVALAAAAAGTLVVFGATASGGLASAHTCLGRSPTPGDRCISLPVKMVAKTTTTAGGCGQALFMQVPLELSKGIVEYAAEWSWGIANANPPPSAPWIFTATAGRTGTGSGPFAGEQTWSTTALTPKNTGVNVHYKVPNGFGAWFVAAGGGSGPCVVKTGRAKAWAWVAHPLSPRK